MKNKSMWAWTDLVIPVFALILSVYYLSTIWNAPAMAQWYGGGLSVVNIAFFAVAVFFVLQSNVFKKKEKEEDSSARAPHPKHSKGVTPNAVALMFMVAAYIALLPVVGYVVCSIAFVSGVMYFLKERKPFKIALCTLVVSLMGFVLFVIVLNVSIPLDPVSDAIRSLVFSLF